MDAQGGAAIALAGLAAGAINAVVGSGTLITFPTLLALGYPPVTANVSNNIGLVFGGVSGAWGYREHLAGQRARIRRLAPLSCLGAIVGAVLLLRLPGSAFAAIVPVLIALSLVLVILQPRISRAAAARRDADARPAEGGSTDPAGTDPGSTKAAGTGLVSTTAAGDTVALGGLALGGGVLLAGMYGGYFGAAQGVLLVGLLGSLLHESLQRVNAAKNVLSLVVNSTAAVTFLVVRPAAVDWAVVALVAAGSVVGGLLGARIGRWLPPVALRAVIVVVGVVAIARLLLF